MRVLAIEREVPGAAAAPGHLRAEASAVWRLMREDVIREASFDAERHAAVLMLECAGAGAARTILETLPLAAAGCIRFEVIELGPYTGLERLFAAPDGG